MARRGAGKGTRTRSEEVKGIFESRDAADTVYQNEFSTTDSHALERVVHRKAQEKQNVRRFHTHTRCQQLIERRLFLVLLAGLHYLSE